jgi:hypothetical protein
MLYTFLFLVLLLKFAIGVLMHCKKAFHTSKKKKKKGVGVLCVSFFSLGKATAHWLVDLNLGMDWIWPEGMRAF